MMGQPVEQSASQAFGAERFGPFVEGQIAGDQDRGALIKRADQMEEQLAAGLGEGPPAERRGGGC